MFNQEAEMSVAVYRPMAERKSLQAYQTLVLNADGRPLSTWPLNLVSAQDAVHAVYRDRYVVIENWPEVFYRSPSVTIPIPKTVLLREYAPIKGEPKFCRRSVLLRDRYSCQYCGHKLDSRDLTYDHVIPRSRGGKTVWSNIVMACFPCNALKRDSMPNYSGRKGVVKHGGMRPLKEPRQPSSAELLRAGLELLPNDIRETWQDVLYWNADLVP